MSDPDNSVAVAHDADLKQLLTCMYLAYRQSKRSLWYYVLFSVAAIGLLASLYFVGYRVAAALVALVCQICAFVAQASVASQYRRGHAFERSALLNHGLGEPPLTSEWLCIPCEGSGLNNEPYFYSQAPAPPRRLLEDVAECTFFTQSVARSVYQKGLLWLLGATAPPIIVVLLLSAFRQYIRGLVVGLRWHWLHGKGESIEIIFLILAFLTAGEFARIVLQYKLLTDNMKQLCEKAVDRLKSSETVELQTAMVSLLDYSCALMEAPPLFAGTYEKERDKLNRRWKEKGEYLKQFWGNDSPAEPVSRAVGHGK